MTLSEYCAAVTALVDERVGPNHEYGDDFEALTTYYFRLGLTAAEAAQRHVAALELEE
jgi:hypothetical protein